MKTVYKYWKNSNTEELIKSQESIETRIISPIYYYNLKGEDVGENLDLTGFIEISKKKWDRYKRKLN